MTRVVIFSDASLQDTESFAEDTPLSKLADVIKELPAKSAGPHRIKTEVRKAGYTCEVVDLFFYFSEDEILQLCKKLITEDTLVVGFSTTFWFRLGVDEDKQKKFRKAYEYARRFSSAKIVFGGTLAANFASKVSCDANFDGFSEESFIKYLNELSGSTRQVEAFNFNTSQILYEANDCMEWGESPVIEISRGCIFKCTFCAYPLNGKSKLDYIKDESVLRDELITNYEKHGITAYTFSDDTFNDSMYKMEYLHRLFTSLPFKLKFVSYVRLDLIHAHREQISLLKEMGLIGAFFGIETLHKPSGQVIGKGLGPEKIKELLFDLKSTHWKDDVNVTIGLISGLPFETKESHQNLLDWIEDSSRCNVDRIRPAALSVPNPLIDKYPFKSEFQLNAQKYGFYWPDPKSDSWKNMSHEVKSYNDAVVMAKEVYLAAKKMGKVSRGNFGLILTANIAKHGKEPKTLDEIMKMPIDEFDAWLSRNRSDMINEYVNAYKVRKLAL